MRSRQALMLISLPFIFIPNFSQAEFTANVGVASNYVWRGITMTDDRPAVSGGIDYLHPDEHYFGFWLTNVEEEDDDVNEGSKIDIYTGTHFRFDAVDIEVGAIHYYFTRGNRFDPEIGDKGLHVPGSYNDNSFSELLLGLNRGITTLRWSYSDDYFGSGHNSQYWQLGVDYPIRDEVIFSAYYGLADSDAIPDHAGRLGDYLFSLTAKEFSLTYTTLDDHEDGTQSDNFRLTVGWRHEIAL